jgi:hypothetical protein
MMVFFFHEPQTDEGRRVTVPNLIRQLNQALADGG